MREILGMCGEGKKVEEKVGLCFEEDGLSEIGQEEPESPIDPMFKYLHRKAQRYF